MAWIAVLAILSSIGLLWGEHYTPWQRFLGRKLPRTGAYTLGVGAIIAPLMILWGIWAVFPPVGNAFGWAIGTLAADVGASGLTVYALYLIDGRKTAEMLQAVAEHEAQVWRDAHEPNR